MKSVYAQVPPHVLINICRIARQCPLLNLRVGQSIASSQFGRHTSLLCTQRIFLRTCFAYLSPGDVKALLAFAGTLSLGPPVPVPVLVPFMRYLAGSFRSASTGGPKVPVASFLITAAPSGCVVPKDPGKKQNDNWIV